MKILLLAALLLLSSSFVQGHILEEAWEKYSSIEKGAISANSAPFPGELIGRINENNETSLDYPWRYRAKTYEMHFGNQEELARGIYGLAVHAGDITNKTPREKFYRGVLGFHYSPRQIASWLNWCLAHKMPLAEPENAFAGKMLSSGVLKLGRNGFEAGGRIQHVLGAANGARRPFSKNLLHERLHVFWDEDAKFREEHIQKWNSLQDEEKANIRHALRNYNPDNEAQLIEEWAIGEAEKGNFNIK